MMTMDAKEASQWLKRRIALEPVPLYLVSEGRVIPVEDWESAMDMEQRYNERLVGYYNRLSNLSALRGDIIETGEQVRKAKGSIEPLFQLLREDVGENGLPTNKFITSTLVAWDGGQQGFNS